MEFCSDIKASYGGSIMWRGIGSPRVYVGACAGSCLVGWPRKRWIDTVKECLKKRGLDVRQARRMVQDSNERRGFARENDLDEMPQLYEAFEGWKSVCGRAYNFKGIKGKFVLFFLFQTFASFTVVHFLA